MIQVLLNGFEQYGAGIDGLPACEFHGLVVGGAEMVERGECGFHPRNYPSAGTARKAATQRGAWTLP